MVRFDASAQYERAFSIGISAAVFPFGTLCRYAKIAATSLSGMTTAEYRGIRHSRFAQLHDEPLIRNRPRRETRARAALAVCAVALVAACRRVKLFAACDVGRFVGSESARGYRAHQSHGNKDESHRGPPALPTCETTSTNAGSPRFTVAIARFSAGPRSRGFSMGPSPCTPRLFAIMA